MKTCWAVFVAVMQLLLCGTSSEAADHGKIYVLPIRANIEPPLVYIVRRGVKEAMANNADTLVIDMDTNGGRLDSTEEIINILDQFKGKTVTYVNKKAFSAGALISFATQHIYMAPQSVIGAAAPIMLSPTGGSVEQLPETYEAKISSAVSALVRANAEKNGHNTEVADAMVNKTKELKIDGKMLNEKGQLLTLTDKEAATKYGTPSKPLLSDGTVENLDTLLKQLGHGSAEIVRVESTGAEKMATWLNVIAPLLLMIGVICVYIEFKIGGFGLPGIIAAIAFGLYFFGGYIAGMSGALWIIVFVAGLLLAASEFFVHPGTIVPGLIGAALMFVAIVMAMVDLYPGAPQWPATPIAWHSLQVSLRNLVIAGLGSIVVIAIIARFLPHTMFYDRLISQSASGVKTEQVHHKQRMLREGQVGIAISPLRPGGKAQFGNDILDVITQGDLIAKGQRIKIIGYSGSEAVVETVG